ncbi:MAG: ComF family protein [bacterium]|nr:ComF family protein [bacterium]
MWLLNILFPQWCMGCRTYGAPLCAACLKNIYTIDNNSHYTHKKILSEGIIDGVVCMFQYKGVGKQIIKQCKYRLRYKDFTETLLLLQHNWKADFDIMISSYPDFVLQPIPLHPNKYRVRGFNQAKIIAQFLQTFYNAPIINTLKRVKNTPPQAQLSTRAKRKQNLKGAFSISDQSPIPPIIVLIDDLYTTGATAIEAARILKKQGCSKVYLFTVAHGV